jgi:serine/threonine protein kinase
MTPRQWNKISRIFSKATELEGPQREAYLKQACQQEDFRREVESLLAQHDKSENFMGVFSSVGGKTLGHYQFLEQVGAGGMALVYKACDTRLNRIVAIKVLPAWGMANPRLRQLLREEAKCASALNHPNIVTVHEIAEQEGVDYIVMEYVPGKTLERSIPSRGLSVPNALRHALEIADALATAHAAAILHGDLKPANIMLTGDGRVKLLDFGLAKALGAASSVGAEKIRSSEFGTRAYMAPECWRQHPAKLDARSEIFSFGLILQEMLTGRHPFRAYGDDVRDAILTRDPIDLPRRIPPSLAEVVHCCLEKSPNRRFQAMRDVLLALSTGHDLSGSAQNRPGRHPTGAESPEGSQIQTAIERISYQTIPQSRQALDDLARLMQGAAWPAMSEAVTSALRDLILTPLEFRSGGPAAVRQIRQAALNVIKVATQTRISRCFKDEDFEHLDLYEMNFASELLRGFKFSGCFLVASSFQGSDLRAASFAGACMRNVNFAEADLTGADFTDADWFNALGLTERQLGSVRQDTLLDCPPDVQGMHRYLAARYAFPFESWSTRIQEQLRATWDDYLSPNGLREVLARRREDFR